MQVRRLLEAIAPAVFDDLTDLSPHHGWVPLDLVAGWLSETLNARYGARRARARGRPRPGPRPRLREEQGEARALAPEALAFLGYYNHDPELFKPPRDRDRERGPVTREERAAKKQSLAERRLAMAKRWADSFRAWASGDEERREALARAYNRAFRGRIVPTFSPEPLEIARWGPQAPKLRSHQVAGARRVLAQRGGPGRLRRRRRQDLHGAGDHRPRPPGGLGATAGDPGPRVAGLEVARRHPLHAARLPRRGDRIEAPPPHPRRPQRAR
ncbi:MAG: hypothetical protein H6711_09650 [Myxococcales bacterium]|nr:hypothetical protein [Myxococcales bacterium]